MWAAAIRVFDQRANVLNAMAEKDRAANRARSAAHHETLAREARDHAKALRRFVFNQSD